MPTLVLLAGPNGAGKTTFINGYLSERPEAFRFVNPDEVARDLPGAGPQRDLTAGRRVLERLEALVAEGADIVLETTLATRSHAVRVRAWKAAGYRIDLIYLALPTVEDSIARVAKRVLQGGHDIPEARLRRRFDLSLEYFETLYKPLADEWEMWVSGDTAYDLLGFGRNE